MSHENGGPPAPKAEDTIFIVMTFRQPKEGENPQPYLSGWCVVGAHGIKNAIAFVLSAEGLPKTGTDWVSINGGGFQAYLPNGRTIQILPSPCYVMEENAVLDERRIILPRHVM